MGADIRLADYVAAERDRIVATLLEWLRIPSISAHPDHAGDVRCSAAFCADLLKDAGLEHVGLLETAGGPAVYGDWLHAGPDAPTVVVYGHHDVQPVDPIDAWTSPPFSPVIFSELSSPQPTSIEAPTAQRRHQPQASRAPPLAS